MFEFPETWTDEIAELTTDPEYQNATVRIYDPSLVTETYDISTGVWNVTGNGDLYSGQARVVDIRWGVNRENSDTGNPTTIKNIRVQLPKNILGRLKRGMKMVVTSCTDNPSLETFLFSVSTDIQGSNAASRTIEFAVDGDLVGT